MGTRMAIYHHDFHREATLVPSVYFHDISNTHQSPRAPEIFIMPFKVIFGPSIGFTEIDYGCHLGRILLFHPRLHTGSRLYLSWVGLTVPVSDFEDS